MMDMIFNILLWVMAIASGLMAGIYFAFSTFIMQSLAAIQPECGISSMQSINKIILKSMFMPVFLSSTVISIFTAGLALYQWGEAGTLAALTASALYFIGMFVLTAAVNVPLNNKLAIHRPESDEAKIIWHEYSKKWTRANHVRALSSLLSMILFLYAT